MQNPSRFWADWSTRDFAQRQADGQLSSTIAVLPVAATEQHGPHLPLRVDTALVDGVVAATVPHIPANVPALFLPTQAVGFSPEHARFPGTLTLKAETVIRLWTELGESVAATGVKKLVLLNSHGGQVGLLDVVARGLRRRARRDLCRPWQQRRYPPHRRRCSPASASPAWRFCHCPESQIFWPALRT